MLRLQNIFFFEIYSQGFRWCVNEAIFTFCIGREITQRKNVIYTSKLTWSKKIYRWLIYENVTQTIYRWKWIELLPAHTRDITVNYLHFCCQCDSTVIYIQRIKIIHLWGDHYSQVYVIKSIIKTKGLFDVIDYVTTVMTIPVKVKERYLIKKIISN